MTSSRLPLRMQGNLHFTSRHGRLILFTPAHAGKPDFSGHRWQVDYFHPCARRETKIHQRSWASVNLSPLHTQGNRSLPAEK